MSSLSSVGFESRATAGTTLPLLAVFAMIITADARTRRKHKHKLRTLPVSYATYLYPLSVRLHVLGLRYGLWSVENTDKFEKNSVFKIILQNTYHSYIQL